MRQVELPAAPEAEEICFLALDEVDRLLGPRAAGHVRRERPVMLMAAVMTGMRKGELVALRWREVDWSLGRIRVRCNFVRGEFTTPKSRTGRR